MIHCRGNTPRGTRKLTGTLVRLIIGLIWKVFIEVKIFHPPKVAIKESFFLLNFSF
jgi:hypothetical protein